MPVPDFQTILLPLLELTGDGQEHSLSEAVEVAAEMYELTPEELRELIPSGRMTRIYSRVAWAKTHLAKAGLVSTTGRGRFCITERGQIVLSDRPSHIDVDFLRQFPEYLKFQPVRSKSGATQATEEVEKAEDPYETLGIVYQNLRRTLAEDLLERIKQSTPRFFEQLVIDLLVAMGYGGSWKDAAQAVGQSGDEGIDGIIKEDKLGLDVIYVQAKKWDTTVGSPAVQAFAGSLDGQRAKKGVFITTSNFSKSAKDFVDRIEKRIVLIDGQQLAQLMIDHNLGVTDVTSYEIKKVDSDYFDEG
jgi:restriction system protein